MQSTRIAMWSGPRNISTAMMRSWGNRSDTVVVDEPLYSHYLKSTGIDHPGREEVIAAHDSDWRNVVGELTGPIPGGKSIFYQKHMSHHLLPNIDRTWLSQLTHAFLIREPREMLTSLIKNLPHPRIEDTGLPQQFEIFEFVQRTTGRTPPIVDSRDVLENPRKMLGLLCEALGVPFEERMLSWPAGRRETDGVWAKYWYATVEKSTGFESYQQKADRVPPEFSTLLHLCEQHYQSLHKNRLA